MRPGSGRRPKDKKRIQQMIGAHETHRSAVGAFLAYLPTGYTLATNVWTRLDSLTEVFDVDGCFDPALGRYTPGRSGILEIRVCATIDAAGAAGSAYKAQVYRNGSVYQVLGELHSGAGGTPLAIWGSCYCVSESEADYFEVFVRQNSTFTQTFLVGMERTWMAGRWLGVLP